MQQRRVVIVSPVRAEANNGNWQTAHRWWQWLAPHSRRIVQSWPDARADDDEIMLALHARRSAAAVQAWHAQHGARGLGVVLTGTDLYRDIHTDPLAQRSLLLAHSLAVLHPLGVRALPQAHQAKARVIVQSARPRQALAKTTWHLRALMVGHLRDEKDPLTLMNAARRLPADAGILIDHIGAALEPALGEAALHTHIQCAHYRWLGERRHAETRQRIQRAHVLVHTSRLEGGAHVLIEAINSGTPVLATRIDGNVGLLGEDYAGLFDVGDDRTLSNRLQACRAQQDRGLLATLREQCAARASLFEPRAEQAALHRWVQDLWIR